MLPMARMDDEGLVNLLVTIVFVAVWVFAAIASKRHGKTQQPSDHSQPEEPDLMELEPSGPEVGPVVLPQKLEPVTSRPMETVSTITKPVSMAIPEVVGDVEARPVGGLVAIPLRPDKLREAVLLSEILDKPVGLRGPRIYGA